ncbi:MAG: hypothetical protein JEY96_19390 [Bacteroidales bacterium]|nr:hypothetical protein [Bacteroidales bacterium]
MKRLEKYSSLITVIAIIVAVEYSESNYDFWDIFLGAIGLIFWQMHRNEMLSSELLYKILLGFLFSISSIAILYTVLTNIPISVTLKKIFDFKLFWIINSKVLLVLILTLFETILLLKKD